MSKSIVDAERIKKNVMVVKEALVRSNPSEEEKQAWKELLEELSSAIRRKTLESFF